MRGLYPHRLLLYHSPPPLSSIFFTHFCQFANDTANVPPVKCFPVKNIPRSAQEQGI